MKLINKGALVAEIERNKKQWTKIESLSIEAENMYLANNYRGRVNMCNEFLSYINSLEVKEVDLEKEKVENIKKQCPFREVVCSKYQNHPLKCTGACAFVSDRITLEKKHLHDIQNVPVDEEKLKMDRRNTV